MATHHEERANEAMNSVMALIDELQRLSSDSCLLLAMQIDKRMVEGWLPHGQSSLDVMHGVRRCLRTLFAWVPYDDPNSSDARLQALQNEKKEVERRLWHSQQNHEATMRLRDAHWRRINRLQEELRGLGKLYGFNGEEAFSRTSESRGESS